MALRAVIAVYGAMREDDPDSMQAAVVTAALQDQFNQHANGVVTINNQTMGGDPAKGHGKHFGAVVEVDGVAVPFACAEGQTIDFS